MKLTVTTDDLKDKKLMVATPMYGGQCAGIYNKSTNELAKISGANGLDVRFYYLFNESLITRARNYCVDSFLRSDCTHLLFIDSDIGFNASDVFLLMHLCGPDNGYDIVAGPYPKKTIAWEKVKKASDMGYGKSNPFELSAFIGDFVFNNVAGQESFRVDEPVEVSETGTGFMMIHRGVFEKYVEAYPDLRYKPDHVRDANFDGSRDIHAFFDTIIDPETRRYLSEDYMFCQNVRKAGMKVWLCPWMELQHVGTYTFGGSVRAMGLIQSSPTADAKSNQKSYSNQPDLNQAADGFKNRKERRKAMKGRK
jgi:hypothetical protein